MPYSPVYSSQLILYTAAAPNTSFLVPAGNTAVIRQISFYQPDVTFDWHVYLADSEEAPSIVIACENDVALNTMSQQEGRWVCPPGSFIQLAFSTLGESPNAYVGGYLLQNVID